MTIKEEFEKAFKQRFTKQETSTVTTTFVLPEVIALWAAKWMAEMCALIAGENWLSDDAPVLIADRIRQLAKELDAHS